MLPVARRSCISTEEWMPPDFILLSTAVARLEEGMYGGFQRPLLVEKAKETFPRASIGFGPQREEAAAAISCAVFTGKMRVYVVRRHTGEAMPLLIPVAVLKIL